MAISDTVPAGDLAKGFTLIFDHEGAIEGTVNAVHA